MVKKLYVIVSGFLLSGKYTFSHLCKGELLQEGIFVKCIHHKPIETINQLCIKQPHVLFVHLETPAEIDEFMQLYPKSLKVLVHNNDFKYCDDVDTNELLNYDHNFHVYNGGSLHQLSVIANSFCKTIQKNLEDSLNDDSIRIDN